MSPLEEIKSKLSVDQVVGDYIPLKQAGLNFKGLCPFHNEKTPSFVVSPEKQIWHCFGCNEGGDMFMFVQKHEGVEFREAVKILAEKAGVPLNDFRLPDYGKKKVLFEANDAAQRFYETLLWEKAESAGTTREYLSQRGLSDETVKAWGLGMSGPAWDSLYEHLRVKFSKEDAVTAGLVIARDGKTFDRFRKRLMFPILDVQGKTVGFTARTLSRVVYDEDVDGGKYVNSPQTPIYNKSQILYGFDKAKSSIRRQGYVIIVEGNMDVIMSHQAGVTNVVAASGTALTLDQLNLIKRHTENIILSFDADTAGSQAVFRGITLAWELGMNVKVIVLKDGKDPADVVALDPELWRANIKNSIGVVDFYFEEVFKRVDLSRADHKKQAAGKIAGIISQLGSSVEQAHYVKQLSDRLRISEEILWPLVRMPKQAAVERTPEIQIERPTKQISHFLVSFVAVYQQYLPRVIEEVEPEMLISDIADLYKKMIIQYTKANEADLRTLTNSFTQEELKLWSELAFQGEETFGDLSPEHQERELLQLLNRVKAEYLRGKLHELAEAMKRAEMAGNASRVDELLREYQVLTQKRSQFLVR